MSQADILDTIFKITTTGGGIAITIVAVRIALAWARIETQVKIMAEQRAGLVLKNDTEHKEIFVRLDGVERIVANMRGRQGLNGGDK